MPNGGPGQLFVRSDQEPARECGLCLAAADERIAAAGREVGWSDRRNPRTRCSSWPDPYRHAPTCDLMRPVIEAIEVIAFALVTVRWQRQSTPSTVRLDGWIRSGGPRRRSLLRPECFGQLRISQFGNAVLWDCCEDAVMSATVLWQFAEEQRPFTNEDARAWQAAARLTNDEVAGLFGISNRTWRSYRTSARIPRSVALACRAMSRDPVPLQAHIHLPRRPRRSGSPPLVE